MDPVPFHIGVATDDLATSMREIGAAFGLTWTPPAAGEGTLPTPDGGTEPRPTSCISREGPVHVDLVQSRPGTIWATDGPRLHHLAYWTDDLAGDVARLTEEGWQLEVAGPTHFAYLRRADGFRLELVDRANRDEYLRRLA